MTTLDNFQDSSFLLAKHFTMSIANIVYLMLYFTPAGCIAYNHYRVKYTYYLSPTNNPCNKA
jgi:hypothetical protein